jgi:ATP-dependent DNA helicase RecQ
MGIISGVVSVPPTKSGMLVENFARRVANMLQIDYKAVLVKARATGEQKNFVNKAQKEDNVKNAFTVSSPQLIAGHTLLLIDDIYDSGHTLRAVTKALRAAGALAVYPFTITRTMHSDDQ